MKLGILKNTFSSGRARWAAAAYFGVLAVGMAGSVLAASSQAVSQHAYRQGEVIGYFFEDTDLIFDASVHDGVLLPGNLKEVHELQIPFSVTVTTDSMGGLRRTLRFQGGQYRKGDKVGISTTSLRALSGLIPGFPSDFSYDYGSDSQAIRVAGQAYAPFTKDAIGSFVYYKALDIHTIPSVIENIPGTLEPGGFTEKKAAAIELPNGTFHNAPASMLYQRVEVIDGVRCAWFKVVTMGNDFTMPTETLYTNYQYTFAVPLEGPKAGLLLRGELQETVLRPPGIIIQRQLSMTLTGHSLPERTQDR